MQNIASNFGSNLNIDAQAWRPWLYNNTFPFIPLKWAEGAPFSAMLRNKRATMGNPCLQNITTFNARQPAANNVKEDQC